MSINSVTTGPADDEALPADSQALQRQRFDIEGMTCAACSARVEKAVAALDGVTQASVNLASERLDVVFDPARIGLGDIVAAVTRAGYEVAGMAGVREVRIPIEGMTCAACSSRVERVVGALPGVASISVNLLDDSATLRHAPGITPLEKVFEVIERAGYRPLDPTVNSTGGEDAREQRRATALEAQRRQLLYALAFTLPLLVFTMGHMLGLPLPAWLAPETAPLGFALAQLALTLPVVWIGRQLYRNGARNLWQRAPNMDSLILLGTGSAMLYSLLNTIRIGLGDTERVAFLYYETAAAILTFIMIGKYLEALSRGRTSLSIRKLMSIQPRTALVLRDGRETETPIDAIEIGARLRVKPGQRIPLDGRIEEGQTAVDESLLTGESLPVAKQPGDPVTGGSFNQNGSIVMRVEHVGADTTLAQIVRLVEQAQSSKAPIARLADRISGIFVPIVISIATLSSLAWWLSGESLPFALSIFIAVMVIACPCALGLATPTAIMVGTGKGAEFGVLIKGGAALERLRDIDVVVFDKTGTLTEGKPAVVDIVAADDQDSDRLLQLAASAEAGSEHVLGSAIVAAAEQRKLERLPVTDYVALPGQGLRANVGEQQLLLGNLALLRGEGILEADPEPAEELARAGKTPVYAALDGRYAGLIAVADPVRDESPAVIRELEHAGIETVMLTGDNRLVAEAVAREIGISRVIAGVLPADKAEVVAGLQREGKRVAMVGDGINDSPALARADVGIAIGAGTDIALETAEVVLMRASVGGVLAALELSRATLRNIRQNLFWAFAYNSAGIPVAAGLLFLFGGPLLNPMIAAMAMALSSVSVVSNALRLRRFEPTVRF